MRMHHPIADRSAIVIGAGAAGLSCAASLAQSIQVTLLEASGRVGGRCHTVADLGSVHGPCELGATWLHGVQGNPAYELCESLGLLPHRTKARVRTWHGRSLHLRSDGVPLRDPSAVLEVSGILRAAVEEAEAGKLVSQDSSLGAHVRSAYRAARPQLLAEHGEESAPLLDAAWARAERFQCAVDGCANLGDQACGAAYANYDEGDGKNVPSRPDLGGYSAAMEALAKPLRERGALHLGRVVRTIKWGVSGVEVVCEDGGVFSADACCVAVPLEPLRALTFEPPLPEVNRRALELLGLGAVEKIYVAFEKAADEGSASQDAAQGGNADGADLSTLNFLWLGEDDDDDAGASAWCRGLTGLYRSSDEAQDPEWACSNEAQGAEDPSGVESGPPLTTLVGWLTGDEARAVSGRDPAELLPELLSGLQPMIGQLPGSWRPVHVTATAWCADPHYQGSYSYPRVGAAADVTQRLATPLVADPVDGAPVVCFAGEATSAARYGTVCGAIESGRREAARILKSIS